jgi:hypothetical protein
MTYKEFPSIRNYRTDVPTMPRSPSRNFWKALFAIDFTLGLSDSTNGEGEVPPKTEQPGVVGTLYRAVYDRLFRELETQPGSRDFWTPLPVPEVDAADLSQDGFHRWRRRVDQPLVVRGLAANSHDEVWSTDWLVSRFGDRRVECINLDHVRSGLGQNIRTQGRTLEEFLLDDANEGYYINNLAGVFDDDDVAQYRNAQAIDALRGRKPLVVQWFISRTRQTGTPFHCADGHNLFTNLRGQKEWLFVHPSYGPVMQPGLSRYAIFAASEIDDEAFLELDQLCQKHPILRRVPKYHVVLDEGDVLYVPPWWWHRVLNRTRLTIGCAVRYNPDKLFFTSFGPLQLIDLLKHPRRSALANVIRLQRSRGNPDKLMENIFSK